MKCAIILGAGKATYNHLPIHKEANNLSLPINGKPVIFWVIQNLIEKGVRSTNVVIQKENKSLIKILNYAQSEKCKINIVKANKNNSILQNLKLGLANWHNKSGFIVLGDSLITDEHQNYDDFIFTQGSSL